MMTLTERAQDAVRSALSGGAAPAAGLRIMAVAGGCAGLQYRMGLVTQAEPEDTVVSCGDVALFVDPESRPLLEGTCIDFVETVSGAGFVFENPNAGEKCSCGKSFNAA